MINQIKALIIILFSQIRLNKDEINGNLKYFTLFKFHISYSLELPFSNGRTVRGVKFNSELDIYSKTVKDILNEKNTDQIIISLYKKYKSFEPKKVSDLNSFISNRKLRKYPIWAMLLPWEKGELSNIKQRYLLSFHHNRSENGMRFKDDKLENIETMIYSKDTAKSHVFQFKKLIQKIKKRGYIVNYNDLPTALIFIKDKKWFWMMSSSGNHRAHIMSELKSKNFKCRIVGIIKYSELDRATNVTKKIFNQDEARFFFDKIFKGYKPIRGHL